MSNDKTYPQNTHAHPTPNGATAENAYAGIKKALDAGEAPLLDDLKSVWTSKEANRVIRELTKQGFAGVHRRRLRKADGKDYTFGEGVIDQRGPGRFIMKLADGSEAYLTAKSSKGVVAGDKIKAFLAHEAGADTEALPSSLIDRDYERAHAARARATVDGQVALFLDNRVEDVQLTAPVAALAAGDLWFVKIADRGLFRDVVPAVAVTRLGNESDKGIESKLAFETRFLESAKCVESDWPQKVELKDAKDQGSRIDARDIPFATIDGESTNDFDDAIAARPSPKGGWDVDVAIADVSAFVTPGSKLDDFARQKMTSVYLPHEVHPMLPRSLSNGVCSLNPGEERFALCCRMHVSAEGEVETYEFYRGRMASHARLTYTQLQAHLDGGEQIKDSLVAQSAQSLSDVAKAMREAGAKVGRLDMGDDELSFVLGENGKIASLQSGARLWSHKIVEECMLAANRSAAEFVGKNMPKGIFRNHAGVKAGELEAVHLTLAAMGLKVGDGAETITQRHIAEVLEEAKTIGKYSQARSAILSGMSSASYEADNKGHFSLVAPYYCHFTSPIRRYADLIVHRLIKHAIDVKLDATLGAAPHSNEEIEAITVQASKFSQQASQAENEARKLLMLDYAKNFIGQPLQARAATIGERGVWTSLPFPGASLEFFLTAKAMKGAGMQWSDTDQQWAANGKPLLENDEFGCQVVSCEPGSRRVELSPVVGMAPIPKIGGKM